MLNINTYILEKFKITKDIKDIDDSDLKEAYDFLVKLFDEDQVHYTIEMYEDNIKVIITDKYLLDKKKANIYIGNINTTLYANKINYRGLYPTINKQGNRKISIAIFFYKRGKKN